MLATPFVRSPLVASVPPASSRASVLSLVVDASARALGIAALVLVTAAGPTLAAADQTKFRVIIVKDTKDEFRAHGTWSSIDNSLPPDGFLADSTLVVGQNWSFKIFEKIKDWNCLAPCIPSKLVYGADEVVVGINGWHLHGPHVTDHDPNRLDNRTSLPFKYNIPFGGKPVTMTAEGRLWHRVTGPFPHADLYGVRHIAASHKGPPNLISGTVEVTARHTDERTYPDNSTDPVDKNPPKIIWGVCFGGTPADGSNVSYDAISHSLTIHIGAISFLNASSFLGPGIEPRYVGDPILAAHVDDIVLSDLGPTSSGGRQFGAGHVSLTSPDGDLGLEGDFSGYQINQTTLMGTIDSYALFDSLTTINAGECGSRLVDDFGTVNVLGDTIPSTEWLQVVGNTLSFATAQDLAALTAGFTLSAMGVPATVGISAAKRVPPVAAVGPEGREPLDQLPAYPNPFAERTTIHYRVAQPARVRIDIFDASGRLVRRLVEQSSSPAGDYSATWDGRGDSGGRVAAGVYLYRVSLGTRTWTHTLVLVK